MTVTSVQKDPATLTMSIVSEFEAPVERVWQLWEDPRQLERWWGPPTYPATVVDHDLTPGGAVNYFMTGPEGDQAHGWWRVVSVDAPRALEFEDGFGNSADDRAPDMPVMTIRVTLDGTVGGATRMTINTVFPSLETMEKIIEMGMEEGMASAIGQIDDLLRVGAAPQ
jgi:uncharacterized protein YndB with AHSA1/START domain